MKAPSGRGVIGFQRFNHGLDTAAGLFILFKGKKNCPLEFLPQGCQDFHDAQQNSGMSVVSA